MRIVQTTFIILFAATIINAQSNQLRKYASAAEAFAKNDTVYAISLLKESISTNKDAASYYGLAKLLARNKTHTELTNAIQYSRRAVELDDKNISYRLLLARIREDLFYVSVLNVEERAAARMEYEKIIEIDSNCVEAHYNLGRLLQEDFHKFTNSYRIPEIDHSLESSTYEGRTLERSTSDLFSSEKQINDQNSYSSSDMVKVQNTFRELLNKLKKQDLSSEVDKLFYNSEVSFRKAISIAPSNFECYSLLARLYIENKQPEKIIPYLINFREKVRSTKDVSMYLGLAYYLNEENEKANREFQKAMIYFSKEELEEFKYSTAAKVLEPKFGDKFSSLSKEQIADEINKYWSINDPLLLTAYNESSLEHFARVAYANLFFYVPKLNLTGWKTDRGEVLLRYGHPARKMRFLSSNSGAIDFNGSTEFWLYDDKVVGFEDRYMNNNYTLMNADRNLKNSLFALFSDDDIHYLKKTTPRIYQPTFEGPVFNLPLHSYQFKSEKNGYTDSYLVYGINPADTLTAPDMFSSGFDLGVFMFDNRFNAKFKKRETIAGINDFAKISFEGKQEMLVSSYQLTVEPTSGSLAFEMLRKKDKGVFANHGMVTIKYFGSNDFSISDIVLCADVKAGEKVNSFINRGEVAFLPNPVSAFSDKTPLFIYYEIYNLSLNEQKLTNFTQQITIRKKEEAGLGNILNDIGDVIGVGKKGEKISLTSDYQTQEKDPQIYLQLDMSKYEPGNYIITVTIKDKLSGKSVSTDSEILWR